MNHLCTTLASTFTTINLFQLLIYIVHGFTGKTKPSVNACSVFSEQLAKAHNDATSTQTNVKASPSTFVLSNIFNFKSKLCILFNILHDIRQRLSEEQFRLTKQRMKRKWLTAGVMSILVSAGRSPPCSVARLSNSAFNLSLRRRSISAGFSRSGSRVSSWRISSSRRLFCSSSKCFSSSSFFARSHAPDTGRAARDERSSGFAYSESADMAGAWDGWLWYDCGLPCSDVLRSIAGATCCMLLGSIARRWPPTGTLRRSATPTPVEVCAGWVNGVGLVTLCPPGCARRSRSVEVNGVVSVVNSTNWWPPDNSGCDEYVAGCLVTFSCGWLRRSDSVQCGPGRLMAGTVHWSRRASLTDGSCWSAPTSSCTSKPDARPRCPGPS